MDVLKRATEKKEAGEVNECKRDGMRTTMSNAPAHLLHHAENNRKERLFANATALVVQSFKQSRLHFSPLSGAIAEIVTCYNHIYVIQFEQ